VRRLRAAGIPADGVVGDPDPYKAVRDVWELGHFDEVVVATLPARISTWLRLDLPRRVERMTRARVTHVVGSERRASAA
jgi:hypothetical protein